MPDKYTSDDFANDVPDDDPNKPNFLREMVKIENARVAGKAYEGGIFAKGAMDYLLKREKAKKKTTVVSASSDGTVTGRLAK